MEKLNEGSTLDVVEKEKRSEGAKKIIEEAKKKTQDGTDEKPTAIWQREEALGKRAAA